MENSTTPDFLLLLLFLLFLLSAAATISSALYDGPLYDPTAYTECKTNPEPPLYSGGMFSDYEVKTVATSLLQPAFVVQNVSQGMKYAFSAWVQISGTNVPPTVIKVRLVGSHSSVICVANVIAKSGCWSFLKGGFVPDQNTSSSGFLYFQAPPDTEVEIQVASASLKSFTDDEWKSHQDERIKSKRKRRVVLHVADAAGYPIPNATVTVQQMSRAFLFGSAISKTILNNSQYQNWFTERFNTAVFENELKWYATEPNEGQLNYTLTDQLLNFVHANRIVVRGHNIFWENPKYTPPWVRNLTGFGLGNAVKSRIESLLTRYKGEFMHWDVNNEMLHFDFYENRLGPNTTTQFFDTARQADPWATLFMNEFNVIETCEDENSTVDAYVAALRKLRGKSMMLEGIGLQAHFNVPNVPYMRATMDKLATLGLPVWLTEMDISKEIDPKTQATYLEEVLREGFSHPSVSGIMLWTALHPDGSCYQMCLTDKNFTNFPAGEVVDKLLQEWYTGEVKGQTDERGAFDYEGFLGEYSVSVAGNYNSTAVGLSSTLAVNEGEETLHFNMHL